MSSAIAKVAGIFEERVGGVETLLAGRQIGDTPAGWLDESPMANFCFKLHMDQRVQEDDPFPLDVDMLDKSIIQSLLIPWKGGRITPSHLSNLIQDAPTEAKQRQLELMAVAEDREPIVRWLQLNPAARDLEKAVLFFQLPYVKDTVGNSYVGQWEFDMKLSGKPPHKSVVLWAAWVLYRHEKGS
jgi:hypothetical protein